MIIEDCVSFEVAKLLKEKGFDEPCAYFYESNKKLYYFPSGMRNSNFDKESTRDISAPTLQMAIKWLREVHSLYITIYHRFANNADNDVCFSYNINNGLFDDGEWLTYEEAVEAALEYALENLIQTNKNMNIKAKYDLDDTIGFMVDGKIITAPIVGIIIKKYKDCIIDYEVKYPIERYIDDESSYITNLLVKEEDVLGLANITFTKPEERIGNKIDDIDF